MTHTAPHSLITQMKHWKSLALQTAPWCFHLSMAPKQPSSSPPPPPPPPPPQQPPPQEAAVRLVGSDGRVRVFRRPVTAAEVMQQHPRHLLCRSDAFLIGRKIPAVAPGERLLPGHAYFLLPAHLFHSVLSFVSLASSLLLLLHPKAAAAPFEIHRTASGTLQIRVSDEFLLAADEAAAAGKRAALCSDERLEKEYEELVGYGKSRRWRPKLEAIAEASGECGAGGRRAARRGHASSAGWALPLLGRARSRRKEAFLCSNSNSTVVACSG